MKDWRRINVTFTRAKSKLVILGSRKTLQASPVMKEFFDLMDEKGWILDLAKGDNMRHDVKFEEKAGLGETIIGKRRSSSEVVVKSENAETTRSLKKAINGVVKLTHIVWKLRMHKPLRLLHKDIFT